MFYCFWLSVPVKLIAWKVSSPNDLLCVEWDVKPYTLTHSLKCCTCISNITLDEDWLVPGWVTVGTVSTGGVHVHGSFLSLSLSIFVKTLSVYIEAWNLIYMLFS